MTFPNAHSHIYRNEAGEVMGWSDESAYEPEYCDICGSNHSLLIDCTDQDDEPEDEELEEEY